MGEYFNGIPQEGGSVTYVTGGGGNYEDTYIVSGGQVTWSADYVFIVSAAEYYINGVRYTSVQQNVTLDAADGSNNRIDVIVLNTSGTATFVKGTAAATPSEPDVDAATQIKLVFVLVTTGTTEPVGTSSIAVYLENAGSGGAAEWDWTDSGASWNPADTTNPRTSTKCYRVTNGAAATWGLATIGTGTLNPNSYAYLVFYIRSATWAASRGLRIQFQNTGVKVGNTLTITTGYYGFDGTNTTDYQQIAIPIAQFAVPAGTLITQVKLTIYGGALWFAFDDMKFVTGGVAAVPSGITQEFADARYLQIANAYGTLGINIDGGGVEIADGVVKADLVVPYNCTIQSWTLLGDVSGAIKIDIWRDSYANYPPTDADTITNAHEPEIAASGVSAQDLDLSDWTSTSLTKGQILRFNVDSCTTITAAQLSLGVVRV